MKSKNVETLIQEREDLRDLLEDIMERIQEFREEIANRIGRSGRHDCGKWQNRISLIRKK